MLEAEISPSGEVLVEGHHVGELQGFRFTADQSADGEDAKAVRAAAQKGLAQEFELRAERFANAPNGDLALGSEGTLRWIGTPVATLASTEDALKPRPVLLADEQLTGVARDRVFARAERFVNYQIDTLLKPLLDLKGADQLAGISRGIAFQLVEKFGLINRREVAEDIRALDQDSRGALRRLGVRFGAYHIFVPALIKPGPAGLLTLLWALSNDGRDRSGFGDVVHSLASGRTSVVVDPAFEPEFYGLAGYRVLGHRAVRVDILERLADLIRPALSWKRGIIQRPEGAFDGNAFLVTPAMMSILGATAEDMEEILKGLGYQADAKQAADVQARLDALDAAVKEAAAKAAAEKATADAAKADSTVTTDAAVAEEAKVDVATSAAEPDAAMPAEGGVAEYAPAQAAEVISEAPAVQAEPSEPKPASAESVEEAPVENATATADKAGPDDNASAAAQAVAAEPAKEPTAAVAEEAEESKPVLVWRPGRSDSRPRHNPRHKSGRGGAQAANEVSQGEPGQQRPGGKPRFNRNRGKGKPGDGGGDQKRDRNNDRQGQKPTFQNRQREERPVKVDPDSPFAKLAALRDQLKK